MLAKKYRLQGQKPFRRLYRRGRLNRGSMFDVRAVENNRPHTRFAVVASTKISKKAVVRNRIRRRLYGLIGEMFEEIAPGLDIALIVKKDLSKTPADDLRQALHKQLPLKGKQ